MGKTKKRKLNRRRIRALSAILFSIPFVLYTALVPAIKAGAVTTNLGDHYLDPLIDTLKYLGSLGTPQTVEYSEGTSLPVYLMKLLKDNPNLTLVFTTTYEGVEYTFTIKGSEAIVDLSIPWYGPLWLKDHYPTKMRPAK